MTRPRLLDLFCCEGGASTGYHRAGFDVVGVDINRQTRYPFAFVQADALSFPLEGFDAIHASPPCQAYTRAGRIHKKSHPDLIDPIRQRLLMTGIPWVIENVQDAPIRADLMLCGTMFGLEVRRHRLFESSVDLGWPPFACACAGESARGVLLNTHNTEDRRRYMARHGIASPLEAKRRAMEVPWMGDNGTAEAIPPAYTEWIGRQLIAALERAA